MEHGKIGRQDLPIVLQEIVCFMISMEMVGDGRPRRVQVRTLGHTFAKVVLVMLATIVILIHLISVFVVIKKSFNTFSSIVYFVSP